MGAMPRIEQLRVAITTGAVGHHEPVRVEFNGHVLPAIEAVGGAAAGASFDGRFSPRSMSHSIRLLGPSAGAWEVQECRVTLDTGVEPYTVTFEPFVLQAGEAASLWAERPAIPFDV